MREEDGEDEECDGSEGERESRGIWRRKMWREKRRKGRVKIGGERGERKDSETKR